LAIAAAAVVGCTVTHVALWFRLLLLPRLLPVVGLDKDIRNTATFFLWETVIVACWLRELRDDIPGVQ